MKKSEKSVNSKTFILTAGTFYQRRSHRNGRDSVTGEAPQREIGTIRYEQLVYSPENHEWYVKG